MSDQFKARLTDHFQKVDEARAASAERVQASEAQSQEFRTQFAQAVKSVIEPSLNELRDMLLRRICPAAVSTTPPPNAPEAHDGYIGLHCSNDIKHNSMVARDPMFRVAFSVQRGKVQFYASSLLVNGAPEESISLPMTLEDLTTSNVEALLLDFIGACFPQ